MASVGVSKQVIGDVAAVYPIRNRDDEDKISVVDFKVKTQHRFKKDGEWVDGDTIWTDCTAWGKLAENIVDSLKKWDQVIVVGQERLKSAYEKKDGTEVPARVYLNVDNIALSLAKNSAASSSDFDLAVDSNDRGSSKSNTKTVSKKSESKPEAKKESKKAKDDDLEIDFDDDGLFGDDDEIAF